MKVDILSLVIGLCALATFAVPIMWYQLSEKKKTKKLHNVLTEYAQQRNLTLTNEEFWSDHYALGIDKNNKKLLYLKHGKKGIITTLIDLSKIQKCNVSNRTKMVQDTNGKKSVLTNINLLFQYLDPNEGRSSLEIYDESNGRTLSYEISIANTLAKRIQSLLKTNSKR